MSDFGLPPELENEYSLMGILSGIVSAEPFPEAGPSVFRVTLSFGPDQPEKVALLFAQPLSGVALESFDAQSLVREKVIASVYAVPRQIGPFQSEASVFPFKDKNGLLSFSDLEPPVPFGVVLETK